MERAALWTWPEGGSFGKAGPCLSWEGWASRGLILWRLHCLTSGTSCYAFALGLSFEKEG